MSKPKKQLELAPNQRLLNGDEYLEYCRRAQAGEFHIPTVDVKGAHYLITLSAPIMVPKAKTTDEMFEELFT